MDHQLDEPDLRSYLGVIARRKWWVAGITVIFFALAVVMSVVPDPQYRVRAKVKTPSGVDLASLVIGQGSAGADVQRQAQDQLEFVDSNTVRYATLNAIDGTLPTSEVWNVQVEPVAVSEAGTLASNVVELSLVTSDPQTGVNIVTAYAKTYLAQMGVERERILIETLTALHRKVDEVSGRINTTAAPIAEANRSLNEAIATGNLETTAVIGQQLEALHDELDVELGSLRDDRNYYQRQLDRLEFAMSLPGTPAQILSPPLLPRTPVSPNIPQNLAIGLVFGAFLGVGVAFIRDFFDDSIKSKENVERAAGVPALGLIPKFDTAESELVALNAPSSPAAEAFRSLRTSVKFLSVDREVRVVQVTSPSPGEGKTVTAANLAIVFAQAGDRVVLVGADLRRPRAEEILGVPLTPGLTGVLIGEVALPQAIRTVDGVPNLSVLPAGYPPPNPSEMLGGERSRRLIDVLSQTYDLVILDCPPVLPVTDALVLAGMSDTTLLVASAHRTSRRSLDRCVEVLKHVDAPLMGAVITSLDPGATFGSESYGYDSGRNYPAAYPRPAAVNGGYVAPGLGSYPPQAATAGAMQTDSGG